MALPPGFVDELVDALGAGFVITEPERLATYDCDGLTGWRAQPACVVLPGSAPEVQAVLVRWHQHLRYFYEPTLEILRGLGNTYNDHPGFNATFTAIHPDLPPFLQQAINHYVDVLELAEIEAELALLELEE